MTLFQRLLQFCRRRRCPLPRQPICILLPPVCTSRDRLYCRPSKADKPAVVENGESFLGAFLEWNLLHVAEKR